MYTVTVCTSVDISSVEPHKIRGLIEAIRRALHECTDFGTVTVDASRGLLKLSVDVQTSNPSAGADVGRRILIHATKDIVSPVAASAPRWTPRMARAARWVGPQAQST